MLSWRLQHNIQGAYEVLRRRCRAPSAYGLRSSKAILSILEDESNYELIAPSWKPVYRDTIQRLTSPAPVAAGITECPPLYLRYQWTSVKMVNYLGLAGAEPPRQPMEVLKAFFASDFPTPHRDIIYQARIFLSGGLLALKNVARPRYSGIRSIF